MVFVRLSRPGRVAAILLFAGSTAALAQSSAPPGSTARSAPTAPRIPEAVIERMLTVGAENDASDFMGLHKFDGDTTMLSISSARQSIAFSTANAVSKGGRYNPPASARADVVVVTCGDEDLGERWDCGRLSVVTAAGKRVAPLSYSSGAKTYKNAMGASWTATTSTGMYRLADLADGFDVVFAGTNGSEFTYEVSADDVASRLFTELPPTRAMLAALQAKAEAAKAAAAAAAKALIDAEPEPPAALRGIVEPVDGGQWRVMSESPGYTWQSCSLVAGVHKAPIPPLAPNVAITAALPPTGVSYSVVPTIQCIAKGRMFEGPVPKDFGISVERKSADMWTIRNLSDRNWKGCEVTFGEKTAAVDLPAKGLVTLTGSNFRPGPPRADEARSAADLKMMCTAFGARVEAVQKPAP